MDRRVDRAIELMRAERVSGWTVEELATAVNLSANQFRCLFTRDVGVSPKCFDRRERLHAADNLLRNSFLSVKQVMAETGFADRSYFNRAFKAQFGIAPGMRRQCTDESST